MKINGIGKNVSLVLIWVKDCVALLFISNNKLIVNKKFFTTVTHIAIAASQVNAHMQL